MKAEKNRGKRRIPVHLPVFLAGLLAASLLVYGFAWSDVRQRRESAVHTAEICGARLEALLESLFHKTDVLESIIITSGGSVPREVFEDLAKSLSDGVGIRAIQYLPDGIVKSATRWKGTRRLSVRIFLKIQTAGRTQCWR